MFLEDDEKINKFSGYSTRTLRNFKRQRGLKKLHYDVITKAGLEKIIKNLITRDINVIKKKDWFKLLCVTDQQKVINRHYKKYDK